jgi:hypothetical protein
MYWEWNEVPDHALSDDDPFSGLLERTWNSISYDTADHLPFAGLDMTEENDFDIKAEVVYPVGVVIEGQAQGRRATRKEWE